MRPAPITPDQIAAVYRPGMGCRAIAEALGCPERYVTVWRAMKDGGFAAGRTGRPRGVASGPSSDTTRRILAAAAEHPAMSKSDLARHLSVSRQLVQQALARHRSAS